MADKYISVKPNVNGFSFANLGIFSGFGSGIINTVYALVLLDIFHDSATVGIYSSAYYAFCMLVALFAGEFFRLFSKAKLFYACMLSIGALYAMMAFPISPATFIALDFASGIPLVLAGMLVPLFMADFSKDVGIAKLNGRYHLWLNLGALFSPVIAMQLAAAFGNRAAFFAVAAVYIAGMAYFNLFGIIQEAGTFKKVSPRRTVRAVWRNAVAYFRRPKLARAYLINFGFFALSAMRHLYVPIMIIERGFSKDTLGLVLTLGIIPYVVMAEPLGRLARKYGTKVWMAAGFLSFAAFAVWAAFASGWWLMAIFVMWQISGALMEPVHDLLFFDAVKKDERSKYIGVFKTSGNIPRFIAPLLGTGAILIFGATSAVWGVAALIAMGSAFAVLRK